MTETFGQHHFDQIARSRANTPRAAARFSLTAEQVERIQHGHARCSEIQAELYPEGLRIRLDAPMDGESARGPAVGECGTLRHVDGGGNFMMSWDGGSNLNLLPDRDQFTILETGAGC